MQKMTQRPKFITKTLQTMRMILFFLALGLLNASGKGFTQTITFSGKKVTLNKVFSEIEQQTGYAVFASKHLLKDAAPVSVQVKNMQLKAFLELIFRNQKIDYEIEHKTIFVKSKIAAPFVPSTTGLPQAVLESPPAEISGRVLSPEKTPLEGATVTIKGTRHAAVTDAAGKFTIRAGANQVLLVSFIGYQTAEEPINGQATLEIILKKTVAQIDEVVVTALGITRKSKSLSYHVQELSNAEINTQKDGNFVNGLAGKVAGVTINSSSTGIGGSVRVVMRGTKSLFGNNNALYVVDGIPLPNLYNSQPGGVFDGAGSSGEGISQINPEDIASVSVLTGPAAAALYGSQAANGVILVNTKKATTDQTTIHVSQNTSLFSPFVMPQFQNTYGANPGSYLSWGQKLKRASTYQPKDFFQTGTYLNNSISISTGNAKNKTYVSGSTVNGKGIIPGNELTRFNATVRNTTAFMDGRLTLDLGLMYIKESDKNMLAQGQYYNPLVPIYLFPPSDDIEKYQTYERYDAVRNFKTQFWPFGDQGFAMQNPYWITNRNLATHSKNRYLMNASLQYKLNDWINVTARVKRDDFSVFSESKNYASTLGIFAGKAGYYSNNTNTLNQTYADVLVNFTKKYGNFNTIAYAGASYQDAKNALNGYGGNLLSVPNLFTYGNVNNTTASSIQNGYHDQIQSVFGSIQLGYKNSVFIDASARNDWSAALVNTTAKSIFYPSVGFSTILTDLAGINSHTLSYLKLRGSFSEVGNAPQRFITLPTFPLIGGLPATSSYLPAAQLKPERTRSYELGMSLRLFGNKINLDVTAYHSSTYDQLFNPSVSSSTGYSSIYVNAGKVNNKGIEASLGINNHWRKWTTTHTLVFSLNRNKIVELVPQYTDKATGQTIHIDSLNMGGTGSYIQAVVKGGSIGDIYTTTLITDEHGYIKVDPRTRTIAADPNTYLKAGNSNPRYNIGFRNSISWGNLSFNFLVDARIGGVGVSITQAIMDRFGVSAASARAREQGGAIVNGHKVPAEDYYSIAGGGVAGVGSLYVYSATNVRLREASLAYQLPAKLFRNKIKGITFSVIGKNLFMFYNKAPFDPESTASTATYYQGIDYFMQPSLRSIGFTTSVQF